ncbi:MAG: hypothetical protein Q9160_006046 [Pyrenula sp. 1 TL-2023]
MSGTSISPLVGGEGGGEGGEKDGYILQRNYSATSRLNLQYYLWQDTFRFHLHPSIPELAPDARIADFATGSGIWLLDLSEKVPPTTQLEGFDISLSQTPSTVWLPPNVRFHSYNLFSDPPDEFIGRYDVIHIRLIALVIKNNDPSVIIKNLTKMLKPGGHLQWEEYYTEHSSLRHAQSPSPETPALERVRRMMTDPTKDKIGEYILNFDEVANQLAAEGKDPEKETQLRKMAWDAGEEVKNGGAIEYDKKVVVARRRRDAS